jgi:uncharacterized membrane protein YeiH
VCLALSAFTWYLAPVLSARRRLLLWADAVGLALFSVLGCAKALAVGSPPVVAVVMGVMSASFGGLIRDTLLGTESVLFGPELYVTAALAGAVTYAGLISVVVDAGELAILLAMLPALILRSGAILYEWRLPPLSAIGWWLSLTLLLSHQTSPRGRGKRLVFPSHRVPPRKRRSSSYRSLRSRA